MKLIDTITTPDVDQDCSQGNKDDKNFEAGSNARGLPGSTRSNGVIAGQDGEDEQCDDLEGKTCKGNFDTSVRPAVRCR